MTEPMPLIKVGAGEWSSQQAVRFGDVWSVEHTTGPDRLIIGPAAQQVDLLLSLAQLWRGGFFLLYVLLVPRQGKRDPGRYQSPGSLSFAEITAFCHHFQQFLETDGRHHIWIGSTSGAGTLIYDQHNWIWAYGDLDAYIKTLTARGFTQGPVELPVPHSHNYHPTNDQWEEELMAYWKWVDFPLQPGDEY